MYFKRLILLAVAFCLPFTSSAIAQEKLPPNAKVIKLAPTPERLEFKNPFDYRQLRIDATLDDGNIIDATRIVQIKAPAGLLSITPTGIIRPLANGTGELIASVGALSVSLPVSVSAQKALYPVSFIRDVMPSMSKLGCNAGTCHGSAEGKNGFKLSLRGYDPIFDHRALTDDLEGRRFNRAAPERSLMLMKPAGAVPHVGGVLWQPGEPNYEMFKLWIAQGVKLDLATPRVTSLEVLPKDRIVPQIGQKQQMVVMARYGDGTIRDVTAEAFVDSSNTEVATIDKTGLVTTVRRGEATMLARYEGAYSASTLMVMGDRSNFQWNNPEAFNYVDELVYEKLKKVKVQPSDICTDEEFIRRIYIDLTGLPPLSEDVRAFVADMRSTRIKREALVDKLIGSEPFIEHWTNKWADLLQVNRKFLGDVGAKTLRDYIRNAVATNMPYDKFAYSILTASGSNAQNGPASYYKVLRTPDAAMENTTHLFMAIRFNCNKCHDHPFERWTQDQYYNLASYFAQITRSRDPKYPGNIGGTNVEGALPIVEIIADTNSGEFQHARTGQMAKPTFPFLHKDLAPATAPRRVQLAKWITSKENPYFAKSYVNRLWSYLLGVGIIEPIDDIRAGNPATNPALLDRLSKEFIDSNFDVRKVMRTICKSRTYQLSIKTNKWNEGDEINYSHALARRLSAEALFDAIYRITGSTSKIPGLPPGSRAAQVLDGSVDLPSGFLDLFGKPVRESACECERSSSLMLGPVLNLVNGPIVADAIKDPDNRIAKLAATVKDNAKFVEEIYLSTLSRLPTPEELQLGLKAIKEAEADYKVIAVEHSKKLEALRAYEKQLDAKQADWEKKQQGAPKWEVLSPDPKRTFAKDRKATTLNVEKDQSIFVTGANPNPELYTVEATTRLAKITAIRLEALADDRLPGKGPGRAPNGNFVLHEFKVTSMRAGDKTPKPVALHKAQATFSQDQFAVAGAIDGNDATGWAIVPQTGKTHVALFELKEPLDGERKLTFTLDQKYAGKQHNLGKFRLSVTSDATPRLSDGLPAAVASVLAIAPEKRTPDQKAKLTQFHREQDPEYKRLQAIVQSNPLPADSRILGGQDIVWALINSPAFLFNH